MRCLACHGAVRNDDGTWRHITKAGKVQAKDHEALPFTQCADCNRRIDPFEVFPKHRCVDCHAKAPEVRIALRTMTADGLARMWGG